MVFISLQKSCKIRSNGIALGKKSSYVMLNYKNQWKIMSKPQHSSFTSYCRPGHNLKFNEPYISGSMGQSVIFGRFKLIHLSLRFQKIQSTTLLTYWLLNILTLVVGILAILPLWQVGLKPAGGVRTTEQAISWMSMIQQELGDEWVDPKLFRIGTSGTSSLVGNIAITMKEEVNLFN